MYRPCMINCSSGLKQNTLQVSGHALFYLHGFHLAMRNEKEEKNSKTSKLKYIYPPGIEPATPLDRVVIGADILCV